MSQSIDQAFIKQFEAEVKLAYQRDGSKLTNCARRKDNVKGTSTTFQKAGKGSAGQKSRHGLIPLMNIDHTNVECTLADYYAGDYVDKLDELKTNIDERGVVTKSGAMAMGRKSDTLMVAVLDAATGTNALIATGAAGLTQGKINTTFERFGNGDIPDDGDRFACIGVEGWTDLLGITAFSSSDYVGEGELPYKGGMVAKRWMGFLWFTFSGLSNGAGGATDVKHLFWHKSAVGFASGQEITSDVSWVGERGAHFIGHSMSQGAVVIDAAGVQTVDALR